MTPVEVLPEMTLVMPKIKDLFGGIIFPKRICIDLDGVICQYDFPKIVKNFFGVDLVSRDIFAYNLADVLGVSPPQINAMFREQVFGKPNLIEGAIETLREWKSKKYELIIYSNRVKYMGYHGLANWLVDWQIPFTDIDSGEGVYDVHIDDSPGKLMATESKLKLLFSQPWNERCLNITGQLIRVKDWQEVRCAIISIG